MSEALFGVKVSGVKGVFKRCLVQGFWCKRCLV